MPSLSYLFIMKKMRKSFVFRRKAVPLQAEYYQNVLRV